MNVAPTINFGRGKYEFTNACKVVPKKGESLSPELELTSHYSGVDLQYLCKADEIMLRKIWSLPSYERIHIFLGNTKFAGCDICDALLFFQFVIWRSPNIDINHWLLAAVASPDVFKLVT